MKKILILLLLTASITAATKLDPEARMWKRAGFLNPIITTLSIPAAPITDTTLTQPITHVLDTTLVMFRNTGWTQTQVEAHLKRTNEIYAQCGIQLGTVKLVESDAYQGRLDINQRWTGMDDDDDRIISKATPIAERPVIYLMRDILPRSHRETAYTNYHDFKDTFPLTVRDTIWISSFIESDQYPIFHTVDQEGRNILATRDPSYDVFAHELAHLLGNMGHEMNIKEKNLLNGSPSEVNGNLIPRQCELFKKNPLLRKI